MALNNPNTVFSTSSIQAARFGFERVWYNYAASALVPLATGTTQIFDISGWNQDGQVEKVCVLDRIAATQNAGVQIKWSYDGKQSDPTQNWTDAYPAGMRWWKPNVVAKDRLALFINNQTGAAINTFQVNYAVTVKMPAVSDDILLGFNPPQTDLDIIATLGVNNPAATPLGELQGAVKKGMQPLTFGRILELLIENRLLPDDPAAVPFHLTIPAGAALSVLSPSRSISVASGELGIVRGVALEGAPAVLFLVDRDGDPAYIANYGTSFTQGNDAAWDVYVPFKTRIGMYMTPLAALATTTTYPGNLLVSRYKLSDLLALHMRMTKTPAQNYAKVIAGWQ